MIRHLRHRLDRRRHPARYARLDELLAVQRLSPRELARRQQADLNAIARFAACNTPIYGRTVGLFSIEKCVAALEFSERRLAEWADLVRTWRPALLYGYASALAELARYVVDQDLQMPGGLLGAYCTAEVLHDGQRDLIERAFGCKVFNQYGCRKVPNIAWECRHGSMHVFADMMCLESVSIDGEDRLLVTSLTNRLMPFIRYDLGDSGRLLEDGCACGSPFPTMQMDLCRHNDLIRTRAGRRMHPAYFNRLLYGLGGIGQYQRVQHSRDHLTLNLVAGEPLSEQQAAGIRHSIQRDLDRRMALNIRNYDAIPRTVSGKHRIVTGLPTDGSSPLPLSAGPHWRGG
jgi:phenylacetate-CoA ligase